MQFSVLPQQQLRSGAMPARRRLCSSSSSSSSTSSCTSSSSSCSSSSSDSDCSGGYHKYKTRTYRPNANTIVTEKECRKKIITVKEDKDKRKSRPCERACRKVPCKKSSCKTERSCSKRCPQPACRKAQRSKCRPKPKPKNVHFCTTVATEDRCGKVHTFSKCYSIPDMRYRKGK